MSNFNEWLGKQIKTKIWQSVVNRYSSINHTYLIRKMFKEKPFKVFLVSFLRIITSCQVYKYDINLNFFR